MNHRYRRLTTVTTLALATLAAAAACTSAGPARPAPAAATAPASGAAAPSVGDPTPAASPSTGPKPVRTAVPATTRPHTGSGCLGAVVHRIDASDNGPPWKRLCMTVGGVLVVANLGPDGFSASSDAAECHYEAAVRQCRLLRPGSVRFTITNAHETRTLNLVIVKASSPAQPAPACKGPRSTFTIDAAEGGPGGWPVCMRASGVVRVINLGPEGFAVTPSGAVTCSYEAAVRECRFTRAGTVTFTTTHGDDEPRTQKVVAIR
jgi:hypothetical protein